MQRKCVPFGVSTAAYSNAAVIIRADSDPGLYKASTYTTIVHMCSTNVHECSTPTHFCILICMPVLSYVHKQALALCEFLMAC